MANLNRNPFSIKFKQGADADINATATKELATEGEPHWTTDTDQLYVFDGNENIRVHGLDNALVNDNGDIMTKDGDIIWLN